MSVYENSATTKLLRSAATGLPGGAFLGGNKNAHNAYADFFQPLKEMVSGMRAELALDYTPSIKNRM